MTPPVQSENIHLSRHMCYTIYLEKMQAKVYADAVAWAAEEGITGGVTATTFAPNATCTRAQVVTFLYRDMAE